MVGDADGKPLMPPQMLHMILPRKDYEIVADSWDVVGLRGTGSRTSSSRTRSFRRTERWTR